MGKNKKNQILKSKSSKKKKNTTIAVSHLSKSEFPIVGVGASAGGLDALKELFNHLPDNTGAAYICIQHLDPKHESILTELLRKETKMPVYEVKDGMSVEPDNVYVIPPAKNIELVDEKLRLTPRKETAGEHMVIDRFFRSLAEQMKTRAIGIILSGLGSDGTLGIRAIKAEGGLTFAQTLNSAKYDYMPRSAISSGDVDIVDSPSGIAEELKRIGKHPYIITHKAEAEELIPEKGSDFNKIFVLLRTITNVDFSQYKPSTVNRRIARRMVVNRSDDHLDYLKLLKTNRKEVDALYNDLLINVTNFFRDPATFEALKQFVFPRLIFKLEKGTPLRIWVPGCSTGEEVYSVAILLIEYLSSISANYPLQFFATDISEAAIEKARSGIYTENIKQDVSSTRLKRFFREFNGGYQINKNIRDLCIFARHDVTKDPPFSRIDLISCRNLLIYLNQSVQKKVIPTFHYALKPNGMLLLGSSESIGGFADLFNLMDKKYKFYERKQASLKPYFDLTLSPFDYEKTEIAKRLPPDAFNVQKEAEKILLNRYVPPGVLVDDNMNIIQFRGNTGSFLEPAPGAATFNLYKMCREGLLLELRNAIQIARRTGKSVNRKDIDVKTNNHYLIADIEVIPIRSVPSGKELNFLILFKEKEKAEEDKKSKTAKTKRPQLEVNKQKILKMEEELTATKEYLQSIIEEKDSANEELRSTLEELQSSNEELQSTNEEMETAKEELQSANEELTTVNEELENRNEETSRINNDLMNLLASVNIAILMLGNDMKIRRFTPAAERILNLIPSDIGRSFNDIKPNIILPNLDALISDAIDRLETKEFEVQDMNGNWYSLRLRPYKTIDNKVDGAVLSLVDINMIKKSEMTINEAKKYAEAVLDAVKEPVLVLADGLMVSTANKAFCKMFNIDSEKIVNTPIFNLNKGWENEKFKENLYALLEKDNEFDNHHIDAKFLGIGLENITLSAKRIYLPKNNKKFVLITLTLKNDGK